MLYVHTIRVIQAFALTSFKQLPVGPGRGMPAGRGMGMMPPSETIVAKDIRFIDILS